jgi:hypothetical protein
MRLPSVEKVLAGARVGCGDGRATTENLEQNGGCASARSFATMLSERHV